MRYNNIRKGIFKSRPNRFIAICDIDGREEICHVKNTGRCRELLIPGATVYLEESENPARKTKFDLVSVYKGSELFNIDSQAPNKVFGEWLKAGGLFKDLSFLKPEYKYKSSRFDFYAEHGGKKAFIEVKGVTLEDSGVLMFPDAPTERGIKHITELCNALKDDYEAYIAFIVQTEKAKYFTPNKEGHPAFAAALKAAEKSGVKIICLSCRTEPDLLEINNNIKVKLD